MVGHLRGKIQKNDMVEVFGLKLSLFNMNAFLLFAIIINSNNTNRSMSSSPALHCTRRHPHQPLSEVGYKLGYE